MFDVLNMSRNETVLNYRESLLRKSDVDLLRGPYWLNDSIISFYFEYLENEVFDNHPNLLFVSPEVTQCIKMGPKNDIGIFLNPLMSEGNRKFVFFALNDHTESDSSGGSHWSLLVFSSPENAFFHFDSSSGSNHREANELSQKLSHYFHLPMLKYDEGICLQQGNSYDCGVHLICNAEVLAQYAIRNKRISGSPKINPDIVATKRLEILDIIENLRER